MANKHSPRSLSVHDRVLADVMNIADAVEEELGYVKSLLSSILLMAETDSHQYKLEIVSLAKAAHWMAENLESNIDHFGTEILDAIRENGNV